MHMFKTGQDKRSFISVSTTYALDLLGFSIAFPIMAPLLSDTNLTYFAADVSPHVRNLWIGISFSIFGIMQFLFAPIIGTLADKYGRKRTFIITVANTALGFAITAFGVWEESLTLLIIGRAWTGISSGNLGLSQSATADITSPKDRPRAFSLLIGIGSFGFMFGPYIGGKLANPDWLHGSVPFIFGAVISLLNLLMLIVFYKETMKSSEASKQSFLQGFIDIKIAFKLKQIRMILIGFFLFVTGWGFYMTGSPIFYVQEYHLSASMIGDIFAYLALTWTIGSLVINKLLIAKFKLRSLSIFASLLAGISICATMFPTDYWWFLLIVPFASFGGTIAWTNLSTLLSQHSPPEYQARVMSVGSSMWSLAQVISALVAGAVAATSEYLPLSLGAGFCFIAGLWVLAFTSTKEPVLEGEI